MKNSLINWQRNGSSASHLMSRLQNDFDRIFQEVFEALPNKSGFTPSCELNEDDKSYQMKFEIPGVKKEDVKIELNQNVLTVSAERQEEKREEKSETTQKRHYSEFNYGSYMRSFTLPTNVDDKKVDARFENGVLTVKLPKAETTQSKKIAIQ